MFFFTNLFFISNQNSPLSGNTIADEFLTPLSTPPDEDDFEKLITAAAFSNESEDMEAIRGRFYERYAEWVH